ncbi:glycoside hydrolase family 3 C-terminal domain-containing protein, partial [bacterium]|nr:glycoside hydrolase family 3 C-terminal domain-containing protein [bacterium]
WNRFDVSAEIDERTLREIYFPAFKASIVEAGALSVMSAYNAIDGVPCSCDRWLLTDILRKEWGFKGFVVSDYGSVVGIYNKHNVAETRAEAGKKAVEAGLDIELPDIDCFGKLLSLAKKGKISIEVINESVTRILRVKFWLGLFANPYVDTEYARKICDCREHRRLALEAGHESIILLKNSKEILPLKNVKSIAVIGPNANEIRLGGYSGCGMKVVTPLAGIKNRAPKNTKIYFAEGCKLTGGSKRGFEKAVNITRKSDVAIMFMGNAAGFGDGYTEGETADRCNLDLPGLQEELIKEVCDTGKPVIVVLINGSAITMSKWVGDVDAILEAWYSGEEGGNAIADCLFGKYNPAGRLPITFPKTTGQLPLYYNYKPTGRVRDYVDLRGDQYLFPFGYGLSYTKFKYSNLRIKPKKIAPNGGVK